MSKPRKPAVAVSEVERTLPHSLEAERAVLGAILLHNDAYVRAATILEPQDFFRDAHRRIFSAIARILDRPGGCVDLVTLREDLSRTGELDEAGGPAYIAAMVDGLPRSTNIEHYARIVKDKAQLRELVFAANVMLTDAYVGEDRPETILAAADKALLALQRGGHEGRLVSLDRSQARLLEDLEYRTAHRGELTGVDTGFASINGITGGWQAGDLIVIAARPSIGKTSLAMNSALAGAQTCRRDGTRRRIACFSLEMRRQQIEYRLLSTLSGIPLTRIVGGFILGGDEGDEWARLNAALAIMRAADLHIDDTASRTAPQIRSACRLLKAEGGLDLVVIDYVQLMAGTLDRRGATRNEEIADISRRLKVMADELSVSVMLLSQLSRAAEGRSDPKPKLSDLRDSGSLEEHADTIGFLHRKHHRESGCTNFIVDKARNGPTGTVNLTLDRDTTTFTDGGEEQAPTQAEKQAEDQDAKVKAIIRQRANRR